MLLDPSDFALVQSSEKVLRRLSGELRAHTAPETHASVIELNTGVHSDVPGAVDSCRRCAASCIGSFARWP
jgi:gamma-glutamyl:cysteine ligase YbdK (ATP-grasp superfamily)